MSTCLHHWPVWAPAAAFTPKELHEFMPLTNCTIYFQPFPPTNAGSSHTLIRLDHHMDCYWFKTMGPCPRHSQDTTSSAIPQNQKGQSQWWQPCEDDEDHGNMKTTMVATSQQ
ncbi:hypothetical protein EDB83DRAFT_2320831 [Lactarius deliciosus]|nr:hypothetical protein EDB83DRAFT_2320831 [Lactarius deliciosus]